MRKMVVSSPNWASVIGMVTLIDERIVIRIMRSR